MGFLKKAKEDPSCPDDMKSTVDEVVKRGVPPMGEKFDIMLPQVMVNQMEYLGQLVEGYKMEMENKTESEKKEFYSKTLPEAVSGAMKQLQEKYAEARDEIQGNCDHSKEWFKSQNTDRYKTKADVMKAVWKFSQGSQDRPCHQLTK